MVDRAKFEVDLDRLQEYLNARTKTEKCPFCDGEDWSIPVSEKISLNGLPWATATGDLYMRGLPVLAMTCNNCSFLRLMSLHSDAVIEAIERKDGAA